MRQIKFRGKRIDNGEWIYGSLLITHDNKYFIWSGKHFDDWVDDVVEVIPETVGRFIALRDKNNKEIYEGDILSFGRTTSGKNILGVVYYDESSESFECKLNITIMMSENENVEVVGNIYENSKLCESIKNSESIKYKISNSGNVSRGDIE